MAIEADKIDVDGVKVEYFPYATQESAGWVRCGIAADGLLQDSGKDFVVREDWDKGQVQAMAVVAWTGDGRVLSVEQYAEAIDTVVPETEGEVV